MAEGSPSAPNSPSKWEPTEHSSASVLTGWRVGLRGLALVAATGEVA